MGRAPPPRPFAHATTSDWASVLFTPFQFASQLVPPQVPNLSPIPPRPSRLGLLPLLIQFLIQFLHDTSQLSVSIC